MTVVISILVTREISSNTGKEEVFDTPVPTVTGEDVFVVGTETGVDVINPLDATISRGLGLRVVLRTTSCQSLMVQFSIPKELTSTSDEGIESIIVPSR